MEDAFIITPKKVGGQKESKSVLLSLRIDRELKDQFDVLVDKSKRSRNEVICMALKYALEHLEFIDSDEENIDS